MCIYWCDLNANFPQYTGVNDKASEHDYVSIGIDLKS